MMHKVHRLHTFDLQVTPALTAYEALEIATQWCQRNRLRR